MTLRKLVAEGPSRKCRHRAHTVIRRTSPKVRPPYAHRVADPSLLGPFLVPRRRADYEHPGATRLIHRPDHFLVFDPGVALDEDDLFGTALVDPLQLVVQVRLGDHRLVDRELL